MILIKNYSPTNHFSRSIFRFDDEKLIENFKSLSFETENEIPYNKIKKIQYRKRTDLNWIWTAFIFCGFILVFHSLFFLCYQNSLLILAVEKFLTIIGLILCIPAFRRIEYCSFLSSEDEYLASIQIAKKDRQSFIQVINLIKQKTEIISETNPSFPFPNIKPAFEMSVYDIPYFIKKSNIRFYTDRIVEHDKSLAEDVVLEIYYNQLNEKTKVLRIGNGNWSYVWSYLLFFICLTITPIIVFFPKLINFHLPYLYIIGFAFISLVPISLFGFIKNEYIAFHDRNDEIKFLLKQNSKNHEKLIQIVDFIRSQIPDNNDKGDRKQEKVT
jgi:hypothetical protein